MKKVFKLVFVLSISCLLLAPTTIKLVHTFFAHHEHHFCIEEAKGEIHFHNIEYDCDFQPLFLAPFYIVVNHMPFMQSHDWLAQTTLSDQAIIALKFQQSPYLRGPPHM